MEKSGIEWCDYTYNPITGCLHSCPYCYARIFAKRFCGDVRLNKMKTDCYKEDNGLYTVEKPIIGRKGSALAFPFGFEPTLHVNRFIENAKPLKIIEPSTFFVGAYTDLFGEWVPDEWMHKVFDVCYAAPQHIYLFLTKNPDKYGDVIDYLENDIKDHSDPPAVYLGATATNDKQLWKAYESPANWLSIEPLQEELNTEECFLLDTSDKKDVPSSSINKIILKSLKKENNPDKKENNPDKKDRNPQSKKKESKLKYIKEECKIHNFDFSSSFEKTYIKFSDTVTEEFMLHVFNYCILSNHKDLKYITAVIRNSIDNGVVSTSKFDKVNKKTSFVKKGPLNNFEQEMPDFNKIMENQIKRQQEG